MALRMVMQCVLRTGLAKQRVFVTKCVCRLLLWIVLAAAMGMRWRMRMGRAWVCCWVYWMRLPLWMVFVCVCPREAAWPMVSGPK